MGECLRAPNVDISHEPKMGYELLPLLVTVETLSVKLHHEQEDAEAKLDGEQLKLSSSC